ncbi:PP2C phosphatase [Cryptosporidium felis]|nr:PP2C phosphatase [Cryptosporidium felis]
MINVARRLQLEKLLADNTTFHTLFIFDIESIICNKNASELNISDKIVKFNNKIYLMEINNELIEGDFLDSINHMSKNDHNLIANFFKAVIMNISKISFFLMENFLKGVFDDNFTAIVYLRGNNIDILIRKSQIFSRFQNNLGLNIWQSLINDYLSSDESTLIPLIIRLHKYFIYLENYLKRETLESVNSEDNIVNEIFEDLKFIIYHLSGNIITHQDLICNINNIHNLNRVSSKDLNKKNKTPIDNITIDKFLSTWFDEYRNTNIEAGLALNANDSNQNDYGAEVDLPKNEFKINSLNNVNIIDSSECDHASKSEMEIEASLESCESESIFPKLSDSIIETNDLIGAKNKRLFGYCKTELINRKYSSSTSIPHSKFHKHNSITPFSKILMAVNTARRRVREYRHKQKIDKVKSMEGDLNFDEDKVQKDLEKCVFWNETLLKCPVFSYNKNNNEPGFNKCSPKANLTQNEPFENEDTSPSVSRRDVEIQVDTFRKNDTEDCKKHRVTNRKVEDAIVSRKERTEDFEVSKDYPGGNQYVSKTSNQIMNGNQYGWRNSVFKYTPLSGYNFNFNTPICYLYSNSPFVQMQGVNPIMITGKLGYKKNYTYRM